MGLEIMAPPDVVHRRLAQPKRLANERQLHWVAPLGLVCRVVSAIC